MVVRLVVVRLGLPAVLARGEDALRFGLLARRGFLRRRAAGKGRGGQQEAGRENRGAGEMAANRRQR